MRDLSNGFLESSERYEARLQLPDGSDVTGDIVKLSVTASLNGSSEGLTLGSTAAATLTGTINSPGTALRDTQVRLFVGRMVGDELEEIPLGVYTITETKDTDGAVEITGYDAMAVEMEVGYFPEDSPATAVAVLTDLCSQAGVDLVVPADVTDVSLTVTSGYTRREIIGYMAALLGCSACMDDLGRLALRWFTPSGLSVGSDEIYTGGLELDDSDFTLGKIECSVTTSTTTQETDEDGITTTSITEDTQTLTAGTGSAGLSISNPWMTQSTLDGIYQRIGGMVYRGGTASLFGDLRHEVGDILTVEDTGGVSHSVPVMEITQEYDGGLKTSIQAYASSETESTISVSGPLTQAVERYAAELALFKTVTADNLTATNAKIGSLNAETAQLQTAIIGKADVTDLEAAKAAIEQLQATDAELQSAIITKASITDLEATNANVDTLNADVANINTLLAGSVGTGNLQAIHITGDNVVIDNAVIVDAMIANLSASKLTAGTIYTSLIKIASDQEESLLIDGSTIQIRDSNGTVRVQIGQDAGGDYSYYLWDEAGNLMWSPTGVTAAGLNDGIIKDVAVAEDANISGSKLNIASVAEQLNEDGSLVVDAANVQIDNTTLSAAYQTIQQQVFTVSENLDNLSIGGRNLQLGSKDWADSAFYRLGDGTISDGVLTVPVGSTDTETHFIDVSPGEGYTVSFDLKSATAYSGDTVLVEFFDESGTRLSYSYITGDVTTQWQRISGTFAVPDGGTAQMRLGMRSKYYENSYRLLKVERGNVATDWTPAPEDLEATVAEVTESVSVLETELAVVQGQISSKVWQTDITDITDSLGQSITALEDNYSTVSQTVQGIQTEIGSLSTTVSDNYSELSSQLTTISATAAGLQVQVTSAQATADAAQESVDNLSIGGVNRALGTAEPVSITGTGVANQTKSIYYMANSLFEDIGEGETFTISFDVEIDGDREGTLRIQGTYPGYPTLYSSTSLSEMGSHVSSTNAQSRDTKRLAIRLDNVPETTTITISNLKLEKGNIATDWTPAPEDLESRVSAAESSIQQTAEEIALTVKKDGVISAINQTAEAVAIDASKIDLTGAVTVSSLASDVSSLLDTAANWVDANSAGYSNLYDMVQTWTDGAVAANTYIQGGWVAANTITANQIAIGDFTNYASWKDKTEDTCPFTLFETGWSTSTGTYRTTAPSYRYVPTDLLGHRLGTLQIPVQAGETLYVEFYYKTTSNWSCVTDSSKLRIASQAGALLTGFSVSAQAQTDWTKVSGTYEVDETAGAYVQVTIVMQAAELPESSAYIWIDDITVRKMTSGELITGSILSDNYAYTSGDYSDGGTMLDLSNGMVRSQNLYISPSGDVSVKGNVTASEGAIGGWTIIENALYQTSVDTEGEEYYSVLRVPRYGNYSIGIGASNLNDLSTSPFRVAYDGRLYTQKMFLDQVDSCLYARSGISEDASDFVEGQQWIRAICGPYRDEDPDTAIHIAPGGGNIILSGIHRVHSNGIALSGLVQCTTLDDYATTTTAYAGFDSSGYLKKWGSSSRRYKHDIQDLTDFSYEDVLKIPVRQFVYNDGYLTEGDPCENKTIPGLIAEEVGEIFPVAAISTQDGEYENWNDRMILVMLLKTVQEQQKQIRELEARCTALEAQIAEYTTETEEST